jgi:hypothetical protein
MSSSVTRALALLVLLGCKKPAPPPAVHDPQVVYRTAILQRAAREGVALTAAERAAVDASLPSRNATRDYLRRQGVTYEQYAKEAYDVALIQKMERRDVFDRVTIDPDELRKAYEARAPAGPRLFVTAIALVGGCAKHEQAERLANVLREATLPLRGHRLDSKGVGDGWALDVHFDARGHPVAIASYDRSRDAAGPTVGPALFTALGAWAGSATLLNVLPPTCIDGSLWVARKVGEAEARPLRFDEASDELEAPLLADRQRKAFNAYVDSVLEGRP